MMRTKSSRISRLALGLGAALLAIAPLGVASRSVQASGADSLTSRAAPAAFRAGAAPADGTLIRDQTNGRVYLIWSDVRHWIVNKATLQLLGFNDGNPLNEPDSFVDPLRNGGALSLRVVDNLLFPPSPVKSRTSELRLPVPSAASGASFAIHGDGYGATEQVDSNTPSSTQAAPVTVRFYQTNGQMVDYHVVLPAKSRATVDVPRDVPILPPGLHSTRILSSTVVPIIAEQSIYSNNFTRGDDEAGIAQ